MKSCRIMIASTYTTDRMDDSTGFRNVSHGSTAFQTKKCFLSAEDLEDI